MTAAFIRGKIVAGKQYDKFQFLLGINDGFVPTGRLTSKFLP
jgi:hypothetical protein